MSLIIGGRAGHDKSPQKVEQAVISPIDSFESRILAGRISFGDPNSYRTTVPTYYKYTKDQVTRYLKDPKRFERQLRRAVNYIYCVSSHFRRLIQYFVGLSDLSYIIEPYKVDTKRVNRTTLDRNYHRTLNTLSSMDIHTQFSKILTVCLREDVFYGTMWVFDDSTLIQQLPSDYCKITSIQGNVPNVAFDFAYFDSRPEMLTSFPQEFSEKYKEYKKKVQDRWIELDAPTSFAIKCNADILDYAMPPFAGVLPEVYDIDEYKQLRLDRTALENYAMLVMKLPTDDDGRWEADFPKASRFYENMCAVIPPEVGGILSPMPVDKISFEKTNTAATDTIAEAEQHLFTASGVSSILFNNDKASAGALLLSIKADQAVTFGIVKGIEDMVNRFIQSTAYGKNFKVTFLDVSPFNRKEMGDMYLKAATYGMPSISAYAASQGIGQAELDTMNLLETEILHLVDRFKPLPSSATQSSSSDDPDKTEGGGAPTKDIGDLSDAGERSREQQ